jgi:hypothetical protein
LASTAVALLLAWNWQLILATAAGIGVMACAYFLLSCNWQEGWWRWRQFFQVPQGKLTAAVGSGGIAALSTYIAAAIWTDAENRWLAVGTILQGLVSSATLLLLFWQGLARQEGRDEAKFARLLADLTAAESLKRLIAVRQLAALAAKTPRQQKYQAQLTGYFRLMLAGEEEPAVREALLENLQAWERKPPKLNRQPLQPLSIAVPQVSRQKASC